MPTEVITKEQVEKTILDATIKKSVSPGDVEKAVWRFSGVWPAGSVSLSGNVGEQTEDLCKFLADLHVKSEVELSKCEKTLQKLGKIGSLLFRTISKINLTSWFDSMMDAMNMFGKYVTQTLENGVPTAQDERDVKELANDVKDMVKKYVDHSVYTKIVPALKAKYEGKTIDTILSKLSNDDFANTRTLIGTLCACVNYGIFHSLSDSWMKHISALVK